LSNKEIDIVIPAYNAGYTIDKTLMSIAIQNIVDKFCVIIVDDCSDKEHRELYQKYISQFKSYFRIDYIKLKKNSGPGKARAEGLKFGNSKYVTFIDADDVFATSTALFTLYNEINKEDRQNINFCNSIFQEEVKTNTGEFFAYYDHLNDTTWMFGKLFRRSFLEKYNINFNNSRSNEDCGFNTLCLLCNNTTDSLYIERLTYCWNYNPKSITKNNDYNFYGLQGYIYNNIWAVHELENRQQIEEMNLNNDDVLSRLVTHTTNTIILLYLYYENLIKNNRTQDELNTYLNWALDFYRDVYIRYRKYINPPLFISCYKNVKAANARLIEDYVESISVLEFLKLIDNKMLIEENLNTVSNNTNNDITGYIKSNIELNPDDENLESIVMENLITPEMLDKYMNENEESNKRYKEYFNF
jgi:glycosyltransferase involved in cell wall biosynthesis